MRRRITVNMMRSIKNTVKTDKEKYRVPRRAQDVIPINRIWTDGIFLLGNKYAIELVRQPVE